MDILNNWKGLENALDAAALRQQVIANNIANAGNPNAESQAVAFEDEMQKALAADGGESMEIRPVSIDEDPDIDPFKTGGGNSWKQVRPKVFGTGQTVNVNTEMANLAKNQIHYNMLVDKATKSFTKIPTLIDQLDRR